MNLSSGRSAALLAGLLTTTGLIHFGYPRPFDQLIPGWIPGSPRAWTYGSGVVELATAALIANRGTRTPGALFAAGLFIAVFPGNIKMAIDWSHRSAAEQAIAYARLPLQIPLVVWAVRVSRVDLRELVRAGWL